MPVRLARTVATAGVLAGVASGLVVSASSPAAAAVGAARVSTSPTAVTSNGVVWAAQRGFVGGKPAAVDGPATAVAGTTDDALYRTGNFGLTGFSQPVANGTYDVTLRMAERLWKGPGLRVFDVSAEGATVLAGVDIYRAVGRYTAYDRTVRVRVADGVLNLGFTRRVGNTVVSAVQVAPASTLAPNTTMTAGPAQGTVSTSSAASFSLTSTQPGRFQCQLDAAAWAACASTVSYSGLALGVHTARSRALDAAGTADATPAARAWTVASATPGQVKPNAGNTGVPAGTVLRPYYGNLTLTTAGAHYDALDVHGFVTVKAPNVTITRSIIRGGVATGNLGLVTNTTPTATNFLLQDSELVPEHPSVWLDAIKGSNYTARRIDAHGTVDAVKVHGDNVRVESSWLHDTHQFASDPNQGGGPSHNDAIQVLGGRNFRFLGNTLTGANNSGLQVTQNYRPTSDLVFTSNWADGGGCTVNINHSGGTSMSGMTVNSNRFGRSTRILNCPVLSSKLTTLVANGNVWADNGLAAPIRRNG